MTNDKSTNKSKVWSGEVNVIYPHLENPREMGNYKPRYELTLLIDKDDKETLESLNAVINDVKGDVKEVAPIIQDGNSRGQDSPLYGKWYITARNIKQPSLYIKNGNTISPAGGGDLRNVDRANVVIRFSFYDFRDFANEEGERKVGVSAKLLGVCKIDDKENNDAEIVVDIFGKLGTFTF